MSKNDLKLENLLAAMPELEDLAPLRAALLSASYADAEKTWAGSQAYLTADKRVADLTALEERVTELADLARARTEKVLRHVTASLRAAARADWADAAMELIAAGEVEEGSRRLDQARGYFGKALELGRKPRDRRAHSLALIRLGRVARAKGNFDESRELYASGFKVAAAQEDLPQQITALQGIGNTYGDQGKWQEARAAYVEGMDLLSSEHAGQFEWELSVNLAAASRKLGAYEEAEKWLNRADGIIRELNDEAGSFFLAHGRGLLLIEKGDPAGAEVAYRDALGVAADPYSRVSALVNLAESLLLQGRLQEAQLAARESEENAITHRVVVKLPAIYRMLGAIARMAGDGETFIFYEQALEICRSGLPESELATTQQEYARLDLTMGERDSALARLKEAAEIFASLGAVVDAARVRDEIEAIGGDAGTARTITGL